MGLIRLIYLSLQEIEVGGYEIRGTPSSELAFSTSRVRSIVPVIQFHIEIRYLARYTFCHCWIRFPFSRFRDQIIRTGNLQLFLPGAMESDVVTIRAGSISPDLLVLVGDTSGCWPML